MRIQIGSVILAMSLVGCSFGGDKVVEPVTPAPTPVVQPAAVKEVAPVLKATEVKKVKKAKKAKKAKVVKLPAEVKAPVVAPVAPAVVK